MTVDFPDEGSSGFATPACDLDYNVCALKDQCKNTKEYADLMVESFPYITKAEISCGGSNVGMIIGISVGVVAVLGSGGYFYKRSKN